MNRHQGTPDQPKSKPQQPVAPRNPAQGAKNPPAEPSKEAAGVEGEGSYTATHRYNEGLRKHIEQHDVEGEAEQARKALEGDERQELERAEELGKRGAPRAPAKR